MPVALTVEREIPSTHDTDGALGTGGGVTTGGGGVGATGVLEQDAIDSTKAAITVTAERAPQCLKCIIDVN